MCVLLAHESTPCIHSHLLILGCSNLTGAVCANGQAAFWYSQGCFIGCPTCDHASGRRQTDLCGLGMKPTNNGEARSLNRVTATGAANDVYR